MRFEQEERRDLCSLSCVLALHQDLKSKKGAITVQSCWSRRMALAGNVVDQPGFSQALESSCVPR